VAHWEVFIALFVVLVFFLRNLAQNKEEERRTNRPRPPVDRDKPPGNRPGSKSSNEIDRFLEEVNRRRRQAAENRGTTPPAPIPAAIPTAAATPPRPRPAAAPQPSVKRPAPAAQPVRAAPERAVRPVKPSEKAVVVQVIQEMGQPQPAPMEVKPAQVAPASPVATRPSARPRTPELAQLAALLQSPQSLRTAMLLKVIFDPPVSRKPGYLRGPG